MYRDRVARYGSAAVVVAVVKLLLRAFYDLFTVLRMVLPMTTAMRCQAMRSANSDRSATLAAFYMLDNGVAYAVRLFRGSVPRHAVTQWLLPSPL